MSSRLLPTLGLFALSLALGACRAPRTPDDRGAGGPAPAQVQEPLRVPLPQGRPVRVEGLPGTLLRFEEVRSNHVRPRTVDVWLPPGAEAGTRGELGVLLVHDGQNQFDPASSFIGVDWGVDEALSALDRRDTLVVAVWNTPLRLVEYLPAGAWNARSPEGRAGFAYREAIEPTGPLSEAYLSFLCDELLPGVRERFPVAEGPEHTFVAGSSMGGLISLEALRRRPDVFGGAACLSPAWQVLDESVPAWVAGLGSPRGRRLWLDHGSVGGEALLAPYQSSVEEQLRSLGWDAQHLHTTLGEGHDHSERSWRRRLPEVLQFLLGPARDGATRAP